MIQDLSLLHQLISKTEVLLKFKKIHFTIFQVKNNSLIQKKVKIKEVSVTFLDSNKRKTMR